MWKEPGLILKSSSVTVYVGSAMISMSGRTAYRVYESAIRSDGGRDGRSVSSFLLAGRHKLFLNPRTTINTSFTEGIHEYRHHFPEQYKPQG